jgi:glutathione S-transferase
MLELYQFELSHYCEKVRLILDYKGLEYRTVEVTPGVGQLDLFRLSGQRQVPVLKDGATVIADSTAIALYLEEHYPDQPILPSDPQQRALCLLMEEWADESIGNNGRKVMLSAFGQHPDLRTAILPATTPNILKTIVGAVPHELFDVLGLGIGLSPDVVKAARKAMQQNLDSLSTLLANRAYLITEVPTLADFAVAGLSMYVKFPAGNYVNIPDALKDKGVPGLADNSAYEVFWQWRDRLYQDYRKGSVTTEASASKPTAINIE